MFDFGKNKQEIIKLKICLSEKEKIIEELTQQNNSLKNEIIELKGKNDSLLKTIKEQKKKLFLESDPNFKKSVSAIKEGKNIFITGGAGTGKSTLVKLLIDEFSDLKGNITSTTGISAINIDGVTIHSWCAIGKGKNINFQNFLNNKPDIVKKIQNTKMLLIDEISMLHKDIFENIDLLLKKIRKSDKAFGGIQLIVSGDFFQLPPVDKDKKNNDLYCFLSPIWNDLNFEVISLTKPKRQNDTEFYCILNKIRCASNDTNDIQSYFEKQGCFINKGDDDKNALHLYYSNADKNKFNSERLKELDTNSKIYYAEDYVIDNNIKTVATSSQITLYTNSGNSYDQFENECKAQKNLELKINCRVMLICNLDVKNGLANGSIGTVTGLGDDYVEVKFDKLKNSTKISKQDFSGDCKIEKTNEITGKKYYEQCLFERKQIPLILAYALTIHKSQGLTIDTPVVVSVPQISDDGLLYVALSRVTNIKYLSILNYQNLVNTIKTNQKVIDFYANALRM